MSSMLALRWTRVNSYAARFRRNPRASGGGHITRDLLGGMPARVRCGGRNGCLAEHPPPKPVTDNLDNFSNRGDSYLLSIPSTPQDKATSTPSLATMLPRSKVIKVTEVIGYRSRPKKRATRIDSKVSDLR